MVAQEDVSHYVAAPPTPKPEVRRDDALKKELLEHDASIPMATAARTSKKPTLAELYAQQKPLRERANPLHTASMLSVLSTHWLQPLVTLGARKILEKEDIWAVCPEDSCDELYERFVANYQPRKRGVLGLSQVAIALLKTFRRDISVIFGNYLVYLAAMVMQPYVAQAILDYLNDRKNMFGISSGYVLVVMMSLTSLVGVSCLNYGFFMSSRVGVNMRSVMMDVVYQKALKLSCVARQAYTTGEIVTLMSVDSERIFNGMVTGPWLVIAPLAFVVTIVLIALLFDVTSALCGACLLVIVLFVSVKLADRIGDLQEELLEVVEERVKVTSEALQGIRVMKFYAWEESLARRVEKIREIEVALYRRFHFLQIVNTNLLFLTPVFLGGLILGLYVILRGDMTVTDAYTLIAMVNISRLAVNMFPMAISAISQANIAYGRIDTYLNSDELDASHQAVGFQDQEDSNGNDVPPKGTISVRDAQFQWARTDSSPQVVVVDTTTASVQEDITTSAHGFVLEGVNIEIDAGSLVMIVGTVGAGKSSLLSALLGEM
ncbi:Abc transporter c family member 2, partial [Globisporangium polare]